MKIRELLDSKEKWCKFAEAKNKNRDPVYVSDSNAYSYCLIGALRKCYSFGIESSELSLKISNYIWNKYRYGQSIAHFNDYYKTTFEDIQKIITELDI